MYAMPLNPSVSNFLNEYLPLLAYIDLVRINYLLNTSQYSHEKQYLLEQHSLALVASLYSVCRSTLFAVRHSVVAWEQSLIESFVECS